MTGKPLLHVHSDLLGTFVMCVGSECMYGGRLWSCPVVVVMCVLAGDFIATVLEKIITAELYVKCVEATVTQCSVCNGSGCAVSV